MTRYAEDDDELDEEREPEEVQTVTVYPPAPCCICGRPEQGHACFRCGQAVCYNQENYFGESTCGGWILDTWHPEHPHGNEFYCNVCLVAGLIPESGLVVAGIPIKASNGTIEFTVAGQVQELEEEDAKNLIAYLWSERSDLFGKSYELIDAENQLREESTKANAAVPVGDHQGEGLQEDYDGLGEIEDHPF
jgi:hypothetical protein